MSTSPAVSVLKKSTNPAWQSGPGAVYSSVSPADPLRQANRLPIKILKMLTARAGHILHPEYLQPLPSTPVSPIEVRLRISGGNETAALRADGIQFTHSFSGLINKTTPCWTHY